MKILTTNSAESQYKMRLTDKKMVETGIKYPVNSSQISFQAKLPHINFQKIAKKISNFDFSASFAKFVNQFKGFNVTYAGDEFDSVKKAINDILGDEYFTKQLQKAGLDKTTTFNEPSFLSDLATTVAYPFKNMWLDLANAGLKAIKKQPTTGILANRLQAVESQKSAQAVVDILKQYENNPANFAKLAAENLGKLQRNYLQRDERTLNRMATSTVSAFFAANDFHNISMLQTDDKKEAKKSANARFKQEMKRMLISAATTFVTMGALNKFIKNSLVLNSLSIAGGSLIAEICSRTFGIDKVPLVPLTPEQAKKIAEKKNKENNTTETKLQDNQAQQQSSDKQNALQINPNNFIKFKNNNGTFTSLNILQKNAALNKKDNKKTKGKLSIKQIIGLAFGAASAVYIIARLPGISKYTGLISDKYGEFVDKLTKKTIILDGEKLTEFKSRISDMANNDKYKSVKPILDKYSSIFNDKKVTQLEIVKKRDVASGVYNGLTKIFKTLYTILSKPGDLIIKGINGICDTNLKLQKAEIIKNVDLNKDAVNNLYSLLYPKKHETGIKILDTVIAKVGGVFGSNAPKSDEEVLEAIKKGTRNFKQSTETGDLANFSRTLVTAISTYFFVNDYRNKVLLSSGGKDIEGAKVETKQRIGHKIANFVINGTLMNLFNSIFVKTLNSSLLGATLIATATELTNETLVRKSICQPAKKMKSKQDILDYEKEQLNKKGLLGAWSKFFMKLTGKKTLTQKAGVNKK